MQYANTSVSSTTDPQDEPFPRVPFDLGVEQAVLGSLLTWNDGLEEIPRLAIQHFFDPLHQAIFAAIVRMVKSGRRADGNTLRYEFENADSIDAKTTAVQYFGQLAGVAVSKRQLPSYAQTITDLAIRRWLILAAEDLAQDARESVADASPLELIESMEARLLRYAEESAREVSTALSFKEAAEKALIASQIAAEGGSTGLKTGLKALDAYIGALYPTDLIVLAGRPAMGKTALATNIAFHVAHRLKKPVGFFSQEMSAEQLALRVLAEKVEVPASNLRSGSHIDKRDIDRLRNAVADYATLPIVIDETGGLSIAQLVSRARRMKRKHGIELIIIDYLQLMQASKRRENRVQDITEITTGLKALAKELNVPVVALSQLSRAVESRQEKRPQLSDLRESGSIEQDADVVLFVYREEYYLEQQAPAETDPKRSDWEQKASAAAGKAEVIVGKQRHGSTGSACLAFSGSLTRFSDLAPREVRHDRA